MKEGWVVLASDYVTFASARKGEGLIMANPLVTFEQQLHRAGRDYPFHWKRNTLTGIEPMDGVWPLFRKIPYPAPAFRANQGYSGTTIAYARKKRYCQFCGYNCIVDFAWDPVKASRNLQKHQVSFEEAQSVFEDPLATNFVDEEHSQEETREFIVGQSDQNYLLLVCFTERHDGIRLISARRATRLERQDYEEDQRS